MDTLTHIYNGFAVCLQPINLWYTFLGCFLGTIIGVLPGIGPSAGIALLIPVTYGMNPTSALIMMCGIFYGARYGGSTTAILINTPGEASSVMTTLDGYQMALQGRGGVALGIAALGSFIAGVIGTLGLMLLAPPLASLALKFGPPEYCMLVLLGLTALAAVGGSVLKGLATGVAGLLLGTIGIDPQVGVPRFDFGQSWLLDGVDFIILAVALFGEKYGETVRTITISPVGLDMPTEEAVVHPTAAIEHEQKYSYELCGGTHLDRTSDVGAFIIVLG